MIFTGWPFVRDSLKPLLIGWPPVRGWRILTKSFLGWPPVGGCYWEDSDIDIFRLASC
jgi:hypothetical protein